MKKITVFNAEHATETGENKDKRLCSFEIEGPEEMDASDGYHTFNELYDHRIQLFIALCRYVEAGAVMAAGDDPYGGVWRSRLHFYGSKHDGWYVLGIGKEFGKQISYHLPDSTWGQTEFAETLDKGPEFDGHTSADVLLRLKLVI